MKIVAFGNSHRKAMDPKNPDAKDTHSTVSTRHACIAQMARIPARVISFWKIDTVALWPNFRIDWKYTPGMEPKALIPLHKIPKRNRNESSGSRQRLFASPGAAIQPNAPNTERRHSLR